jgi:dUTP diphosphatase
MADVDLHLTRLPHAADLPLPAYQSEQAAGLDLMAAVAADAPLVIPPGRWAAVPTGLVVALPAGSEGQVRPRSGLAARHGITVLNAPGTVDADYRGEVQVLLINHGSEPFTVTRGMRIAQFVVAPMLRAKVAEAAQLTTTARGIGGFGSTGIADRSAPKGPAEGL